VTLRQATRALETMGYTTLASTSFPDGVSFDASDGRRWARGGKFPTADEAMASTLRRAILLRLDSAA
jgi:hypothetical protein